MVFWPDGDATPAVMVTVRPPGETRHENAGDLADPGGQQAQAGSQ
jgi:hypothetical protein